MLNKDTNALFAVFVIAWKGLEGFILCEVVPAAYAGSITLADADLEVERVCAVVRHT